MYNSIHAKNTPTVDLTKPIMGNNQRMADGVHDVTITEIAKSIASNGSPIIKLELVNDFGDHQSINVFLYKQNSTELSVTFKKLLAAAFFDSLDTIKEVIQLLTIEDWLVLDYFLNIRVKILLKSTEGYKIQYSPKGYTMDGKRYFDSIQELKQEANRRALTPSYTNIMDITKIGGNINECESEFSQSPKHTEANSSTAPKTNRSRFMDGQGTRPVSSRKKFI